MTIFAGSQEIQKQAATGQGCFHYFFSTAGQPTVPSTRGDQNRLVPFVQEAGYGQITAYHLAGSGFHAHLQDAVDIPLENRFGKPVFCYGGIEQTPQTIRSFKYSGRMAQPNREKGSGKALDSPTDHSDTSVGVRCLERLDVLVLGLFIIGGESLQKIDCHRLVELIAHANRFARVMADPANTFR